MTQANAFATDCLEAKDIDIRPDVMTCAKALSSAYLPIAGRMVSELDEMFDALERTLASTLPILKP